MNDTDPFECAPQTGDEVPIDARRTPRTWLLSGFVAGASIPLTLGAVGVLPRVCLRGHFTARRWSLRNGHIFLNGHRRVWCLHFGSLGAIAAWLASKIRLH